MTTQHVICKNLCFLMGLYLNVLQIVSSASLNTNMIKIIMLPMLDIKYPFEYFIHFFNKKNQTKQVDKKQDNDFVLLNLLFILEQVNYTVT